MVGQILCVNALILFGWMSIWFYFGKERGRLDTVDTAWGTSFILIAWATVLQYSSRTTFLIAILVSIWGVRLSWHLYKRSRRGSEDPRYVEISKKWKKRFWLRAYFSIFLLQGAMVWIIGLPIMVAAGNTLDNNNGGLELIGTAVWLFGFIYESVADRQLASFIKAPANKGKIMQSGLWHYSRHPNYFGEITQWTGIAIIASAATYGWLGFIGPVFLAFLIVFVSGLPLIEKRRANDRSYQRYKQRTSAIIPWASKAN